jgi:hypothetical protein
LPDDRIIPVEVSETAKGPIVPEEGTEARAKIEEKEHESATAAQAGTGEESPQATDLPEGVGISLAE